LHKLAAEFSIERAVKDEIARKISSLERIEDGEDKVKELNIVANDPQILDKVCNFRGNKTQRVNSDDNDER